MALYTQEQTMVKLNGLLDEVNVYFQEAAHGKQIHEAEADIEEFTRKLGLCLMERFIAERGDGDVGREATAPQGETLRRHGRKTRTYTSIFGDLRIQRMYYWEPGAKRGYCPLDAELSLPERQYSYLLIERFQAYLTQAPYDVCCRWIEKTLGITLPKRGQEDLAEQIGDYAGPYYEQQPTPVPSTEGSVLCMQADSKGVRMVPSERSPVKPPPLRPIRRGKGQKKAGMRREAVVTADFSFDPKPRTPEEVVEQLLAAGTRTERKKEGDDHPRLPKNKRVFATMADKEQAFVHAAERLIARNPEQDKPILFLLDGDPALEAMVREMVEAAEWEDRIVGYGLDLYHVSEYVWEVGTALHGETSPGRLSWVRKTLLALLRGQVGRVIGGLRQLVSKRGKRLKSSAKKSIGRAITYFDNHRHMMKYDEYLAAGYPIATGVIEGACNSLVKDRTDRSGMKWTIKGVQGVLNLCAVHENGDQEDFYQYVRTQEHARMYEKLEKQAA